MKKIIKLISLILITILIYFIYQKTNNTTYTITSIGDRLSLGVNSYGAVEYSYIDYYKEYLQKEKRNVLLNKTYSSNKQTIKEVLNEIKQLPEIKRVLSDTDVLMITLGYNDLLEEISLIENITDNKLNKAINDISNNYSELIKEIKKYYHNDIIVVGYYESNIDDYYINKGIKKLNTILNNEEVKFINTYNLLKNRSKFFSNPSSYYPNRYGYYAIFQEIIRI